jgi:hypothetical protein
MAFSSATVVVVRFEFQYMPLPMVPVKEPFFDGRPYMSYSRNMGTAGAGLVRFVSVEPPVLLQRPRPDHVRAWQLLLHRDLVDYDPVDG